MAQFYTFDFEYDGIPSQRFDLKIITFEDGGLFNGVGSNDINILEQRVLRKSVPYFLGRTQETKLEFPLTFGTAKTISGYDRDMISSWLFGRSTYKKLFILQDDLQGAYFNCFLTKPSPIYIGNMNYAFTCTIVCDSPWAYSPQHITSGSFMTDDDGLYPPIYRDIYNKSSEDEYLYPVVYFKIVENNTYPSFPQSFYLTNITDSTSRIFSFSLLDVGDEITVDNNLQIITGINSAGVSLTNLISKFCVVGAKNWFRLLPKYNNIKLDGTAYGKIEYEIRWTERLKIGG